MTPQGWGRLPLGEDGLAPKERPVSGGTAHKPNISPGSLARKGKRAETWIRSVCKQTGPEQL